MMVRVGFWQAVEMNPVEPQDQSVIAYAKRALVLDPNDAYAKQLLELGCRAASTKWNRRSKANIVSARIEWPTPWHSFYRAGTTSLKDRRISPITRLLMLNHIALSRHRHRRRLISVRVFHLHSGKPQRPYCQGTLSVAGGRMIYTPQSATDGNMHPMSFAC